MKLIVLAILAALPTPAQIKACSADAQHYCSPYIGDTDGMKACMLAHWHQISQPCKDSFK